MELIAYKIPAATVAVIRWIANSLSNVSDSPHVVWNLTINGSAVVGFGQMVGIIAPSVTNPFPIALPLIAGQRLAWTAHNTGGVIVLGAAAMFRGWQWQPGLRPAAAVYQQGA